MTGMKKIEFRFGKQGWKDLVSSGIPITYDKVYSWVLSKINEFGDLYENALDVQAKLIAYDIVERLKEGKVLSYYKVLVFDFNEAVPVLRSLAKKAGVSLKRVERYWSEVKRQYMKARNKKEKDLTGADYRYIVGVVKKRLKLI